MNYEFHGVDLICKQVDGQHRIVLPESLQEPTINWYHFVMGHIGTSRLAASLRQFVYFEQLHDKVASYVSTCDSCQRYKNQGPGYGHLPPRNDQSVPWEEIAVDCIGPWKIDIPNVGQLRIKALTAIDTCTTLSEIIRLENDSAPTQSIN